MFFVEVNFADQQLKKTLNWQYLTQFLLSYLRKAAGEMVVYILNGHKRILQERRKFSIERLFRDKTSFISSFLSVAFKREACAN